MLQRASIPKGRKAHRFRRAELTQWIPPFRCEAMEQMAKSPSEVPPYRMVAFVAVGRGCPSTGLGALLQGRALAVGSWSSAVWRHETARRQKRLKRRQTWVERRQIRVGVGTRQYHAPPEFTGAPPKSYGARANFSRAWYSPVPSAGKIWWRSVLRSITAHPNSVARRRNSFDGRENLLAGLRRVVKLAWSGLTRA